MTASTEVIHNHSCNSKFSGLAHVIPIFQLKSEDNLSIGIVYMTDDF